MPILARETCLYPDDLLSETAWPATEVDRRWWALYTKPRQEKSLARDLLAQQVPFYLPLVPKRSIYRGRKIRSLIPMFSGYLFLLGSDEERLKAIATNRVSQLIKVYDPQPLVADLRGIQHLLESDVPLALECRLQPGRRVRVTSGPFMGLEGTVETCKSGYRLIVGVRLLQRGVSLELDDARVELI
jgi:transcriptional antiterminator RfaH